MDFLPRMFWAAPKATEGSGVLVLLVAGLVCEYARCGICVTATKLPMALPGCQDDCGNGVMIPYPFGIGNNCSRKSIFGTYFIVCNGSRPYINFPQAQSDNLNRYMEILEISLLTHEFRIVMDVPQICNGTQFPTSGKASRYVDYWTPPFVFSHTKNKLTTVGCNAFGVLRRRGGPSASGCLASCENSADDELADSLCFGIGCCQAAILPNYFQLVLAIIQMGNDTFPWMSADSESSDADGSRSCGYVFLVEAANYTFRKSHLSWRGNQSFPVVMLWSIMENSLSDGYLNCSMARNNMSGYACQSSNSACKEGELSHGYICMCAPGYQGNPYLHDGCQDIDECDEPETHPCVGICVNTPGSYECKPTPLPRSPQPNAVAGIIIGLCSGLGGLIFVTVITLLYKRFQEKKSDLERQRFFHTNYDLLIQQFSVHCNGNDNLIAKIKLFSLKEIEKATNNFDSSRIVGQGGHGTVYKGLFELKVVAIKKPKMMVQDEIIEFLNEVILLSQVSHRNVVQLIGCCLETEVPILVYEFISNGTLFDHLHIRYGESYLSWEDRLRIATEISSGLAYLHTAANVFVLHRDIKSANILLDERLTVKISDFGASRTIEVEQTHISTNIQGTLGYMDPEYMHTGQLTDKSDVYSLGVIFVEMLTGQRPTSKLRPQEERNLIGYFRLAFNEKRLLDVVDACILDEANIDQVEVVSSLALDCVNIKGKDRPTMKEVEMTLEGLMTRRNKKQREHNNMMVAAYQNITGNSYDYFDANTTVNDQITMQLSTKEC